MRAKEDGAMPKTGPVGDKGIRGAKNRRRHSFSGRIRCDLCTPFRCVKAKDG